MSVAPILTRPPPRALLSTTYSGSSRARGVSSIAKKRPVRPPTSLDFVNNQGQAERLVMFGDPTQCRSRHRVDAAFALDGFQRGREHTRDRRGLEHDLALAHDRPQENAHASVYDFTQPLRLERVDEFRLNGRQPLESVAKAVVVRDALRADVVFPWNEPRKAIIPGASETTRIAPGYARSGRPENRRRACRRAALR